MSSHNSSSMCSPFKISITKSDEIYNKDIEFKSDKSKCPRTKFTEEQILQLEQEFQKNKYLPKIRRIKISEKLNLSEQHVKVWFQNRRMKRQIYLNFLNETQILRQIRLSSREKEESENICPNLNSGQIPVKKLNVIPIKRGPIISSLKANQFKSSVEPYQDYQIQEQFIPQQHFPNSQYQTSNYDFQQHFQQNVQQHTLPHNQLLNNDNATQLLCPQYQIQMLQQFQIYPPQYQYQTYPPQYQYQTYPPQYPIIVDLHQQQGNTAIHQFPQSFQQEPHVEPQYEVFQPQVNQKEPQDQSQPNEFYSSEAYTPSNNPGRLESDTDIFANLEMTSDQLSQQNDCSSNYTSEKREEKQMLPISSEAQRDLNEFLIFKHMATEKPIEEEKPKIKEDLIENSSSEIKAMLDKIDNETTFQSSSRIRPICQSEDFDINPFVQIFDNCFG